MRAPEGAPAPEEDAVAACRRIVDQRRYARHPFVTELDRLQPERAALGAWAVEKYHQVFRQNVIFSAIHANAPDDEAVRRYAVSQLVAEETGLLSGDAPHHVLMRRFAEACGAGPEGFAPDRCPEAVRRYVDLLVAWCRQPDVAVALVVVSAIESQSAEAAGRIGRWLASNRGFTPWELAWFDVHAADEDDHASAGMELAQRLAAGDPRFPARAVAATEAITAAWTDLQDHYLRVLVAR